MKSNDGSENGLHRSVVDCIIIVPNLRLYSFAYLLVPKVKQGRRTEQMTRALQDPKRAKEGANVLYLSKIKLDTVTGK